MPRIHHALFAGLALLALGPPVHEAVAGEGPPGLSREQMAIHGGVLKATRDLHVETAFRSDGIDVYVYDLRGASLPLHDARGTVRVEFLDEKRPDIEADLTVGPPAAAKPSVEVPTSETKGPEPVENGAGAQDRLSASMDLTKLAEDEALAKLSLEGLPGGAIELEVGFRMARTVTFTCAEDGVTHPTPGACEKCGKPLFMVRSYYGCRRHPAVALDREGSCWKDHDEGLELIVEPAVTLPGGSSIDPDWVGGVDHGMPPVAGLRQR